MEYEVIAEDCPNVTLSSSRYILDDPTVRISLWVAYTIVFCLCFFGNGVVMMVVAARWRIRSSTRLCMGNLAFANLCVSIFCIYQNLSTFVAPTWSFGQVLCKTYAFISSLSHTASILTLVAICVERYCSVLKPRALRGVLTIQRLRLGLAGVWLLSALICSPRLYYVTTFEVPLQTPTSEPHLQVICAPNRQIFNSQAVDMIHFLLLFLIPLILMTFLYAQIGRAIWQSSKIMTQSCCSPQEQPPPHVDLDPVSVHTRPDCYYEQSSGPAITEPDLTSGIVNTASSPVDSNVNPSLCGETRLRNQALSLRIRDERRGEVLEARRAVIRMLIAIVVTFAVCNFPYHLRKICQYYVAGYDYDSYANQLLLPLTFLLMYLNCAISPILYAVMSKSFQESLKELFAVMCANEGNEEEMDEDRGNFGRHCYERISV